MTESAARYGVVVIGRNEGERLRQCLLSLDPKLAPLVYVDSGSTDGSERMAEQLGAIVVKLDLSEPFTAARGRNEGFARLLEVDASIEYVQFVDGDCAVLPYWLPFAIRFLDEHADFVAISGRRKERFPERSIYNKLCDLSWQWTPGDTLYFGGDVLLRAAALRAVGGYDAELIAGEESELSIRLRRAGWKIWQVEDIMALHDANILRFGQWWRRSMRTGYAYAQGAAMNGAPPEQHWVRETRSACIWGLMLPLAALAALAITPWFSLALLALYPIQVLRLYARSPPPPRLARLKAGFLVLGKFPEAMGVMKYFVWHRKGNPARLIEYK